MKIRKKIQTAFAPTGQLVVAEQVADDREQDHDPGDEDGDLQDGEQRVPKGEVGSKHSGFLPIAID